MIRQFCITILLVLLLGIGVFLCIPSHKSSPEGPSPIGFQTTPETSQPPPQDHHGKEAPALSANSTDAPDLHDHDSHSSPPAPASRAISINHDFVRALVNGPSEVSITLPNGRSVQGIIDIRDRSPLGAELGVTGRITSPSEGRFHFYIEPAGYKHGPVTGAVVIDGEDLAFRALPGPDATSLLTELPVGEVICRQYAENAEEALPSDHPSDVGIPSYQGGVIPLESKPGSLRVIYIDYDGEEGPFSGWGDFDAAAPVVTNDEIKDVWTRVCEDFSPFDVNITTDLQVFLAAPVASRQRIIVTPTTDASPGNGGVAWTGNFGSSSERVAWAFSVRGKNAGEVIAHEIGHTLGLSHDGRTSPVEEYYAGHGTNPVGWAPIMGTGYTKNLSQWSKGEYSSANQTQDDIAIITGELTVQSDDAGATHATASVLQIFKPSSSVNTEGTIETRSDIDAFKFTTIGGSVYFTVEDASPSPNLDISAAIYDSSNNLIISNNPSNDIKAVISTSLAAGEYTLRVEGVGLGNVLTTGYSDYGSLGQYKITGLAYGAVAPDRLTISEAASAGQSVGFANPNNYHSGAALTYSITSGNTDNTFTIDPNTARISVANPAALNFEALSSNWLEPAAFELGVLVTDTVDPARNENLRVVITVTNANEAPTLSGNESIIAISHTLPGTELGAYSGIDPDRFDLCNYSITAGNELGKFAINSAGILTVVGELDAAVQSSYNLVVRATDQGSPGLTSDLPVSVTVLPCSTAYTPGYVNQTIYEGISGSTVPNLTDKPAFPSSPSREVKLSSFTATSQGDNYGSTIRAWLIAPYTGTYQFWIAGDGYAEFFFNPNASTSPLTLAGTVSSFTNYQEFDNKADQSAGTFSLTAGQVCYIEARHKESTGSDHLSVAWRIKDESNINTIVEQQVIPGRYLSPHYLSYNATNAVATTSGVVMEIWDGISGTSLSSLDAAYLNNPSRVVDFLSATSSNASSGSNYGARIRGYFTPTSTGTYSFSIAGKDTAALLISSDNNPRRAAQIATASATGYEKWTTNPSQTSAPITLTAKVPYYIEARLKQGSTTDDHIAVGWTSSSSPTVQVINTTYFTPYDSNRSPLFGPSSYAFNVSPGYALDSIVGSVTATDSSFDPVRYAILSGSDVEKFSINPVTGAISIVEALTPGVIYQLRVGAQDSGHGWHFTPRETTVPVSITAPGINTPPEIVNNPGHLGNFPAASPISASLTPFSSDPGDFLSFALVSGPSWLTVNPDGTIEGTPDFTQFGLKTFTYSIRDGVNPTIQGSAILVIGNALDGLPVSLITTDVATSEPISGFIYSRTGTGSLITYSSSSPTTSDDRYMVFIESTTTPYIAEYRWTFNTVNNNRATLSVEAFQDDNILGNTFQFQISTDGGLTFTNAILVTKISDDNTVQAFDFMTGMTGTTIVRAIDTDRTGGTVRDRLYLDHLTLTLAGNITPQLADASFPVLPDAPVGTLIGTVATTHPETHQSLSYAIVSGDDAGIFSISNTGGILLAKTVPGEPSLYTLIISATDNGTPERAGCATIHIGVTRDLIIGLAETATISGPFASYSNIQNDGTLRLIGDTTLHLAGTFTNNGVIDAINWSRNLPAGLINNGTILDASAIRVISTSIDPTTFSIMVPNYAGHLYQLESKADLTADWEPVGLPVTGTGSATDPPDLIFSPPRNGTHHFYRIVVTADSTAE